MKITTFFLFIGILSVFAGNSYSQNARVTINQKNMQLEKLLAEIEKQTDYLFIYSNQLETKQMVSVSASNKSVSQVLSDALKNTDINFVLEGTHIILTNKKAASENMSPQQNKTITGTVHDRSGEPLIGVSVAVKGTTVGTMTDIDGKFSINASPQNVLVFTYVGYNPQEKVVGTNNSFSIILEENEVILDDVVVTALGIKRSEKALSYNVQKITSEDLTTVKSANFMNSLAGKVAGAQINSSAAGPGAAVKVVLRGSKSITLSNNALYVIDGVPMNNRVSGGGTNDYSQPDTESAADINPDDIESMSVLTGPSAAALYGYEGANGVILITTKKGRADKTTVTYSNNTTFSSALMMPDFQNKYGSAGDAVTSWGAETEKRFDPKKFFNTGTNVANTVALSTGSEKSQSYLSFSANNASGILPNNDYDRYNFTYRNTTSFLNDKFLLDASINYIIQKSKNMVSQGHAYNPLPALYLFPRGEDFGEVQLYERYDASRETNVQYWPYGDQAKSIQNPYWTMNNMNRKINRKRYMLSASLKYNITEWLNVIGRVNVDNSNYRNTNEFEAGTLPALAGDKGRYRLNLREERQVYGDLMGTLNKSVDDFSFNVNLGTSLKDRRMNNHWVEGDLDKLANWFTTENMGRSYFKLEDGGLDRRTTSIFANAEIGYKNFLYLTLTGRNDWDSALQGSEDKARSFFYPSVGLSGLLSEVVTLPKWFTYLKGRVAFTSVGNSYEPYLTREFYTYDSQSNTYKMVTTRANYNLKPEITDSYELGLNLRFFGGALTLDATYYDSNTKHQTFTREDNYVEYKTEYIQAGKVQNRGIELALGYNNKWGDFSWSTNYTLSHNKNRVKELLADETGKQTPWVDMATLGRPGSPQVRLTKGGTMGDIYMTSDFKRDNNGYIYLDNATLLPTMVNLKGNEYKKIGSLLPKMNMGWRNSFAYKGVRLNVMLSARLGGLVVSNTQAVLDSYGVSKYSAELREAGGVTINGRNISAQDFLGIIGEGTGKGDYYVYDADNVRLQEVSLEYTIPRRWVSNIADITLGLIGSNLAILYCKAPFDPELVPSASSTFYTGVDNFMTPSLRNMGFSVKLQF
ncbi:SusC/RagA family TonB-linked outer membrane protein [Dysgonomonas sp. 511]|uniref:SusC/RagA family TonB-linked outer membrane protein n=1 Tax=Dysgonomonas sp. 511 TaxID=2302930 RepID=UPI0013D5703D|nr:SusC/RagA family TonB-linked outer membrane protein [Dysgonomonas sp. 511]NDV77967.1 SusC/RagA family TonB-linked outer membrane protein [Dysgonomonas sp. 511]